MTALEYLANFSAFKEDIVPLVLKLIPRLDDLYALTTLASTVIYGNLKDSRLVAPLRAKLKEVDDPFGRNWIYKMLIFLGDRTVVEEALQNARRIGMEEDLKKDIEIFGEEGKD